LLRRFLDWERKFIRFTNNPQYHASESISQSRSSSGLIASSGPSCEMFAFDLLRMLFSDFVMVWFEMTTIDPCIICINREIQMVNLLPQ
jgi:hypothetical protein